MAFKQGAFSAPPVELAPCGLLSVAHVVPWENEPWLRGYIVEVDSTPTVSILNKGNLPVTNGTVPPGGTNRNSIDGEGFVIQVKKTVSGMGILGDDPRVELTDAIKAATQKALEYELWEGVAIQAGTGAAPYLRKTGGATVVTSGGVDAAKALRALEQAISNSPIGARGVIHVTRDVASELGSRLLYKGNGDSATEDRAITRLGTRVVIGSGYTGNGPIGTTGAAASETNKWMYATSAIEVELGEVDLITPQLGTVIDTNVNDVTVVVERSAAVHFDPSIWYTAQVTLT